MSMLILTLLLDWLDAIGAAVALVALVHPQLRSQRGLLPAWVAACLPPWAARFLLGQGRDLERFIAAARACGTTKPAGRPGIPRLEPPQR
jgi:hypothetical protein